MDLDLKDEELYNKTGIQPWPFSLHDAVFCLQFLPYATDSTHLLNNVDFSQEPELKILNWDLQTIAKSALYFYLVTNMRGRKESNRSIFSWYEWTYITFLILNRHTSKSVLSLLKLVYPCPNKVAIFGVKSALEKFSLFSRLQISQESFNNLLIFLNIDEFSRDFLIQKTFKNKNFDEVTGFLTIYECSVNKYLIFTNALIFYINSIKNKTLSVTLTDIENRITQLFDSTRIELESFEIFDLFESSEELKSGRSKLAFFSYHQKLLLSLIEDPDTSKNSIEVFQLFESFLYSVTNQTIFLTEIVFENGSSFQKLIVEFCKAYQEKLKKLCQEDAWTNRLSVNSYVRSIISIYVGLLLVLASFSFGLSRDSRSAFLEKRGNFSGAVAFHAEEDILDTITQSDYQISQNKIAEKKVTRTSNGSFASMVPTFSRKNPARVGLLQMQKTPPQALQAPKSGRTAQVFYNKVKQNRVVPVNSTQSYSRPESITRATRVENLSTREKSLASPETTNFEVTTHIDALVAVTAEIRKVFPNGHLSITSFPRQVLQVLIDGVSTKMECATLVGTCVHYSHSGQIRKCLIEAARKYEGLLIVTNPGEIDFDHGLGTVTLKIVNMSRNQARAVALYKPEHNLMTETRKSILPSGLGYTSGTGGVLELIEGLGEENLTIVSGFFEEPKRCDQLITKGYDPDLLYNAYKYNSISDRQTVANKLEDGVSGNIALAIGMDKCFNEGVVDDFTRTPERLGGLTKEAINPVKIGEVFDRVVQTTMVVRDHTNAIRPHIKRDTMAEANFNRSEKTMERTVEIAYEFVEELGAKVNPIIKQNFFNKTPTKSLEEAFDQASIEENFGNLRNPPPAFVGPRQFIGNYKR